MPDFNAMCPFCGEESLRGNVQETHMTVPLYGDGYSTLDGHQVENEVVYVECSSCKRSIDPNHYLLHVIEVTCDCLEAAAAWQQQLGAADAAPGDIGTQDIYEKR